MNVFDCAMKMEEEAKLYFEKMAASAVVPELKNLFTLLAAAEQEHHDALEALKGNINSDVQFKALQEAACLFKPLLARRERLAEQREDPDAYQHVVKEEEKSVRLYEELAAQAKDEGVREILLKIAAEERRHLSIVENIYSFVESPKNYLAWGEFSNLQEF